MDICYQSVNFSSREKVDYDIIWLEKTENKLKDFDLIARGLRETFIITVFFINSLSPDKLELWYCISPFDKMHPTTYS